MAKFKVGSIVRFTHPSGAGHSQSVQHKLYEVQRTTFGDLVHMKGGVYVCESRLELVSETALPFTTGDKVVITDTGYHYQEYEAAAEAMGLTTFKKYSEGTPVLSDGEVVTVLSAMKHEYGFGVVVGVQRENGEQHIVGAPYLEKYVAPVYPTFSVGDRVRVKPSVERPAHGWGAVKHGDVGVVTDFQYNGDLSVNFPAQSFWNAVPVEMELVTSSPLEEAQEEIARLKKVLDKKDAELLEVRTLIGQATEILSEI